MNKMDIHQYEKRFKEVDAWLQKKSISEGNKEILTRFKDALVLENISKARVIRYMEVFYTLCRRLSKDLDKTEIGDIKRLMADITQNSKSAWTRHTYGVMIKKFYRWLYASKDYPEIVSWINCRVNRCEKKLPCEGDLITEQEVMKLINAAEHPRDKAFVSILWESGARIGEIGNMKIKNVAFDKHGIVASLQGKTGSRKIRLISSTPHISTWLANHPIKDDPESPLWINVGTKQHGMMMYKNMKSVLKRIFKKAEIKKRCHPHLFRHSRATFMANHLTEFQMNQYFGWQQGSDMPSTYVHMSGREVDDAILNMNGIKTESKKDEQKMQPRICPRCETINTFDAKHCNKCGGILDVQYAMELQEKIELEHQKRAESDDMMNLLFSDKETQEFIRCKLRRLGFNIPA
jgi:site-specific recombinase XerD